MALRSVSNILPRYSPYILTRSRVQPYYHIIRLRSSIGVRPFTLYSILQLSDTFRSRGYTSFTTIVKERHNREKTNSLRVNFPPIVYYASSDAARDRLRLASTRSSTAILRSPRSSNLYSHLMCLRTSGG
jgi:hypothetical protein